MHKLSTHENSIILIAKNTHTMHIARTHTHTHTHAHAHTHTSSNRLFLIVKLYYAYAIFATYLVQFYVPMDFLEPPIIERLHLARLFPRHHAKIQYLVPIIFRTFLVIVTGEFGSHGGPSLPAYVTLVLGPDPTREERVW